MYFVEIDLKLLTVNQICNHSYMYVRIYVVIYNHHTVQVAILQPPPPVPVEYLHQLAIEKDHQCKLQ